MSKAALIKYIDQPSDLPDYFSAQPRELRQETPVPFTACRSGSIAVTAQAWTTGSQL